MRTLLILASATLLACGSKGGGGGSDGGNPGPDPKPTDLPMALIIYCDRALDGGRLQVNGPFLDATVEKDECLLYRFDTEQDVRYSVQVLIALGGNVDFIVSTTRDFDDLLAGSTAFGSDPETAAFTSTGGTRHLAILPRADTSNISTRVLESLPAPAGQPGCQELLLGGELVPDGTPLTDLVLPRSCVVYTFPGEAEAIYRLVFDRGESPQPDELVVAHDRDLTSVIDLYSYPEAVTVRYFVVDTTGTIHVAVVGDFSASTRYTLSVEKGDAPPGLTDRCFNVLQQGTLATDWSLAQDTLQPWECALYTVDATAGRRYFVSLGWGPQLRIATDSAFSTEVATTTQTVLGEEAAAFDSASAQTYHLAVIRFGEQPVEYSLRALEARPGPSGLDWECNRELEAGRLTAGGGPVSADLARHECATYSMAVQAGMTYTVTAIPTPGSVSLHVGADRDHTSVIARVSTFGGPQGLAFTAPSTGDVFVTVAGRIDATSYTLEAVTAQTPPSGLGSRCTHVVDRGTIGLGETSAFAPDDHCHLYSFTGVAGTGYTIRAREVGTGDPDMAIATDAAFTNILAEATTPDDDVLVLPPSGNATYHIAVFSFQGSDYTLSIEPSPTPPPGLSAYCTSAYDAGSLTVGARSVWESAAPGMCVLFSFSAAAATDYTVTMYVTRGDPSLAVDDAPDFASPLSIEATPGGETYAFTAASTGEIHLAVFPSNASTTEFEIFVTSP